MKLFASYRCKSSRRAVPEPFGSEETSCWQEFCDRDACSGFWEQSRAAEAGLPMLTHTLVAVLGAESPVAGGWQEVRL